MSDHDLPEASQAVERHLRSAGLRATIVELPASTHSAAEAAAALGCSRGAIASSLVFLADNEPLLVMTSGRHRVDTELLGGSLGVESLVMATASRVREVTGQVIGGVAPVGHPVALRTIVDADLADYDPLWAAGGTSHTVFSVSFDELVALTGAQVLRVARD